MRIQTLWCRGCWKAFSYELVHLGGTKIQQ